VRCGERRCSGAGAASCVWVEKLGFGRETFSIIGSNNGWLISTEVVVGP